MKASIYEVVENFLQIIEFVGTGVDALGVAVIVVGLFVASLRTFLSPPVDGMSVYTTYRRRLGRVILLGLELLVAGDIIKTVAVSPTMENMAVLGVIVLIRTFLSFSLELEISGRWPWQQKGEKE